MKKIHTRVKRRYGLSTRKNHYDFFHPSVKGKRIRAKTFKTEEVAHKWASAQGLKKEGYYLKKVKKGKKFEVVEYNGKNKDAAS